MDLNFLHRVYFLGAGGIGMSALARYFKIIGLEVAGYDRTPTDLTRRLITSGIDLHFEDDVDKIPSSFLDKMGTLVVYTPAIPSDHTELNYFKENGFEIHKRSEILGELTNSRKGIAVSGTHGKTTVSTMIAYLLDNSCLGCNAFLGGISKNFNSNLVLSAESDYVVVEADEFDRSFLQLFPFITVVTAMDADHLDVYGNKEELETSFNQFVNQTKQGGTILYKKGLPVKTDAQKKYRVLTYSLNEKADYYAGNINIQQGRYHFDLITPGRKITDLELKHPGLTNVENAVVAAAVAYQLEVDEEHIRKALSTFEGNNRRFDIHINTPNLVYMDDYAHHPLELDAVIGSVRDMYPDKKITGIFQPHLYSRTRDFAGEFARSLSQLDELILMDIYPARELPVKGVSSELIFNEVNLENKVLCSKNNLLDIIKGRNFDVLLTLGAGDIDQFVGPIKRMMNERIKTINRL